MKQSDTIIKRVVDLSKKDSFPSLEDTAGPNSAVAARSSVARSMVARRHRMASLGRCESEPRLGVRSHRPGAGTASE